MARTHYTQIQAVALNLEGAAAPEWIQLTPAGPDIQGRDGRRWTLPSPEEVVAAFQRHGAELPVDIEHATQIKGAKGEPAPAVGWISDMEARDGALWGRVTWTEDGAALLSSRGYRYISPVFAFTKPAGEIVKMVSAALTNSPNLQLAALNSVREEEETTMDKAVLEALGLNSDATTADAVVAINALKERETTALNRAQSPDPEKFVPKGDYDLAMNRVRELEQVEAERTDEAINAAVDAAIEVGKIAPSSRDFHLAACKAEGGLERFEKMIEAAPVIARNSGLDDKTPGTKAGTLTQEEIAICRQLGIDQKTFAEAKASEEQ